jgi:HSP20 family protein
MSFLKTFLPSAIGTNGADASTRRPRFEVKETDGAYNLVVHLPGVAKADLEITDENGALHISGKRTSTLPQGIAAFHRETSDGPFELVLNHDSAVDAGKIEAELKDGVLRLSLAKAESAKLRKIAVN